MNEPDRTDDHIEALLRTTGRRPAVPEERAKRVRLAVRSHWREEVRRRSLGRRVGMTAALAAAAAVIVAVGLGVWQFGGGASEDGIAGRIEVVTASAWARPSSGSGLKPVRAGDEIETGSELTTESVGRLAIRLGSGHSVRLDRDTGLRVLSDHAIALDRGGVYIDSAGPSGAPVHPMEIRTPFGRLRDIGTQFETRLLDSALRVRVREGAVTLDGEGPPVEVGAGEALEIDRDGRTVRRELDLHGDDWAWIGEITPMMELEGRLLVEFLNWMARERGLRLRFADLDVARSASEITLNGSIAGMTLDQALESVLPTCNMRHRIEHRDLVIESLAESSEPS